MDVALSLKGAFQLAGYEVTFSGDYPGWAPNRDSSILKVMEGLYEKRHGTKPHVAACHAGLECGILGQNYPGMDMISSAPQLKGPILQTSAPVLNRPKNFGSTFWKS